MAEEKRITYEDILYEIEKLLKFPNAHICKHYVCCNLLDMLERHNCKLPLNLVRAVVDANDEDALKIIKEETIPTEVKTKVKYSEEELKKWWLALCPKCGWNGLSRDCNGGNPMADTGDYSDVTCPVCDEIVIDG